MESVASGLRHADYRYDSENTSDHFAGNQKILFVMEPVEKEEAFFVYDNGRLKRQSGFYIYYEKKRTDAG